MKTQNKNMEVKLFGRQKLLLALVQLFGGRLSNLDLQKYLFLFTEKYQDAPSYEFIPYRFGCFSYQSYADRRKLIELGSLKTNDKAWELNSEIDYLSLLSKNERQKLYLFKKEYSHLKGEKLIKKVYQQYPYYAINSEIAARIMTETEMEAIEHCRPKQSDYAFFTIGYEGQSFENYLNRLIQNKVRILCDVRKNPISRKYGFSKSTLSDALKNIEIVYLHIPELGIDSGKRKSLNTKEDYELLFDEYESHTLKKNKAALEYLYSIFKKYQRVAITCFEADHCMCHRGRVARALSEIKEWKYPILHI